MVRRCCPDKTWILGKLETVTLIYPHPFHCRGLNNKISKCYEENTHMAHSTHVYPQTAKQDMAIVHVDDDWKKSQHPEWQWKWKPHHTYSPSNCLKKLTAQPHMNLFSKIQLANNNTNKKQKCNSVWSPRSSQTSDEFLFWEILESRKCPKQANCDGK